MHSTASMIQFVKDDDDDHTDQLLTNELKVINKFYSFRS